LIGEYLKMETQKRYKVELVGSISHESPRGRKMEKGKSAIITSKEEVAYYKAQPEYIVSRIRDPKEEKKVATPKAVKRTPSKAPPPPVDEDEEDEDDDDDDDSDEDDVDEDDDDDSDDEDEDEESQEATGHYTKSTLMALTKTALIELATNEFRLKADDSNTKEQLVGGILKAQIAAAKKGK
jgi:hypothetical protein